MLLELLGWLWVYVGLVVACKGWLLNGTVVVNCMDDDTWDLLFKVSSEILDLIDELFFCDVANELHELILLVTWDAKVSLLLWFDVLLVSIDFLLVELEGLLNDFSFGLVSAELSRWVGDLTFFVTLGYSLLDFSKSFPGLSMRRDDFFNISRSWFLWMTEEIFSTNVFLCDPPLVWRLLGKDKNEDLFVELSLSEEGFSKLLNAPSKRTLFFTFFGGSVLSPVFSAEMLRLLAWWIRFSFSFSIFSFSLAPIAG